MRTALASLVTTAVLLAVPAARAASLPGEMRGLWVVRTALVSPKAVDDVVDAAAKAGMNAILVQVRGRGDAFYRSRLAPRSPLLERQPRDFDPLARLQARARTRGIAVHAWVNVLLAAHFGQPLPRGHVLERHPEWAMVPRSAATAALVAAPERRLRLVQEAGRREGDVEGFYLSPAIPAVGDHLESVVREIVRTYPLDGLHFDFIRYPGRDFDWSRSSLEGFRRRSGGSDFLGGPVRNPSAWGEYQRSVLTALAARLADAARAERPGLVLSAAVAPDEAQAVHQKFQDWPRWLASGLLDALAPMTYTPDNRLFQAQIETARERATGPRGSRPVWAGIGAYRLDVAGIVEKVALARRTGADGVVLFSHESLAPADLPRLREEAFPARVAEGGGAFGGGVAAGSR